MKSEQLRELFDSLTESEERQIAEKIVEFSKFNRSTEYLHRYETGYGTKTDLGVVRSVFGIIFEELQKIEHNREKYPHWDFIQSLDCSAFDIELIKTDDELNNFSPERISEYMPENIIRESIANGQFVRARNQCLQYGFPFSTFDI
jgi:hypothetical protein